jgi:hypothetical protein
MKIQVSKVEDVDRDACDAVDALRAVWMSDDTKPTEAYSENAARRAYELMDTGISELLPVISGVSDVGEADFAECVVKALTSSSTVFEVGPVVAVTLLLCYSSRVTKLVVDELNARDTERTVQRLAGRLLLIGMTGQWPASESIRYTTSTL